MYKKAMEFNPIAVLLGIIGGGVTWYMAGSMGSGFISKLFTSLITTVVCFAMASAIAAKG